MLLKLTIDIWGKGLWYVARSPELDFISQGRSPEEARRNLLEVIQIQFEEMSRLGTLDDYLSECNYIRVNGSLMPQTEIDVEIIKNNMRTASMSRDEYFDLLQRV
jgi:predicted RNase H-like HicB family nuclease